MQEMEKEKKLILNFLPIKSGGGLQNSISFLETLEKLPERKSNCIAIVRENTILSEICEKISLENIKIKNNNKSRLLFEYKCRFYFKPGQICFTIFGPPMIGSIGYFINIIGFAYSNLLYPDIPFWNYYSLIGRIRKKSGDLYRNILTHFADYIIFETPTLAKRAIKLFHMPEERVGVVKVSPNINMSLRNIKNNLKKDLNKRLFPKFKFLLLSGAHPNKRLHLLPYIAEKMITRGEKDFIFVTTFKEDSLYGNNIIKTFQGKKMADYIFNLGPIPCENLSTVISCSDAICTFSRLESFSNNFIEAWVMNVPLIVTDDEWARNACGKAAFYVNPEDFENCSKALSYIKKSERLRLGLVEEGKKQLLKHPNTLEKVKEYFNHIEKVKRKGPLKKNKIFI